jgi:hypothetical protein
MLERGEESIELCQMIARSDVQFLDVRGAHRKALLRRQWRKSYRKITESRKGNFSESCALYLL